MLSQDAPINQTHAIARPSHQQPAGQAPSASAPNLVVIGAMKASTTTFYELITRHPNIWFSSEKEPHYFTSPEFGQPVAWQRYLKLFEAAPKSAKYIGEASTGYSKQPHFGDTPQRLQDCLDDPKFIYLVRDPVERTISNYQHAYLSGHYAAGTTLADAIEQDPILIDASCYARQIRAYLDKFEANQLLIITTDELHNDPTSAMRRVESFLLLPPYEGWDAPLPQSNSKQALGRSLALQSFLPKPIFNVLRSLIPSTLRSRLKEVASTTAEVPQITESDRDLIFARISADLTQLHSFLGNAIDCWPSVKKLGEG